MESHDGTAFQLQAEMVYDGRGNRLQAIAHAAGSTITATYTLDPRSGLPLIEDNGTSRTTILYGQAAIGEYSTEWHYYLGDAQLSVRQLSNATGSVTQAQTYAPYGVLLNQAGDGGGLFGYKGGQSSNNGLWYFGNGYFDPHTGQFISQNGDTTSPLATANAIGFFLAPVLFIGWRRRKGKKGIHPATMLFLGILFVATLSSCGGSENNPPVDISVAPPEGTGAEGTDPTSTPTQLPPPEISVDGSPTITPEPTCTPMPTSTPTPSPTSIPTLNTLTILNPFGQGIEFLGVNDFGNPTIGAQENLGAGQGIGHSGYDLVPYNYALESKAQNYVPSLSYRELYAPISGIVRKDYSRFSVAIETQVQEGPAFIELVHVDPNQGPQEGTFVQQGDPLFLEFKGGGNYGEGSNRPHLHIGLYTIQSGSKTFYDIREQLLFPANGYIGSYWAYPDPTAPLFTELPEGE